MNSMKKIKYNLQLAAIQTPDFVRILIVDDQKFDRMRLRRMCEQLDFVVHISEAESLEAMEASLQEDSFHLIFLDYHMPGGSGLDALETINFAPKNRHAATIMVTSDRQTEVAIDAMKNGCSDFLVKDALSQDTMRHAAINALQKASLSRNLETQESMRRKIEVVLDHFAAECAGEIRPLVFEMLRNMRDLQSLNTEDERKAVAMDEIGKSCVRMLDFLSDIEDHERKVQALSRARLVS